MNILSNKPYKILVSACLLGERVRYDGKIKTFNEPLLCNWQKQGLLLSVCPEVCGGLKTPRPSSEKQPDGKITTQQGKDVSAAFLKGAKHALALTQKFNINIAILMERSPSCGSSKIYDGHFEGILIDGQGVTTELLRANGIQVFSQFELEKVAMLVNNWTK